MHDINAWHMWLPWLKIVLWLIFVKQASSHVKTLKSTSSWKIQLWNVWDRHLCRDKPQMCVAEWCYSVLTPPLHLWPGFGGGSWQLPCHSQPMHMHEGWWSLTALVFEQSHGGHLWLGSLWKCPEEKDGGKKRTVVEWGENGHLEEEIREQGRNKYNRDCQAYLSCNQSLRI